MVELTGIINVVIAGNPAVIVAAVNGLNPGADIFVLFVVKIMVGVYVIEVLTIKHGRYDILRDSLADFARAVKQVAVVAENIAFFVIGENFLDIGQKLRLAHLIVALGHLDFVCGVIIRDYIKITVIAG